MLKDFPVFPILLSTDLHASRAFYQDRLGLELVSEREERLVFRCGGDTRLIISLSTVGTADTQTQVAWRVPDVHAAIADLRGRGVRIEEYAAPDPVTTDGVADMGHSWAAWFVDPSGNMLSVIEPKG
jgi:catechol 2,3-dioxygenase-like lactoylglutathione lyase family enzyme